MSVLESPSQPEPPAAAARGAAAPGRPPCSDAERRCTLDVAERVRGTGRRVDVRTHWVRGGGTLVAALHAAVGVAASLLAVDRPVLGCALAGGALLSLLVDAGALVRPVRRLLVPARATQALVSPARRAPGRGAVDLLLTVRADVPRRGLADRGRLAAVGPERLVAFALALLTGLAGIRIAGAEGPAVNAVQLTLTVLLLLGGAALVDRAGARRTAADVAEADAAIAAALRVLAALDADPPRHLAPTLVVCGAGALTMRPVLREQRRAGVARADLAVVEVAAAPTVRWWRGDGRVLPLRYHPSLVEAAGAAATANPELGARPVRGAGDPPARAARGTRLAAIRAGGGDEEDAAALVLALIRRLDASLGRSEREEPRPQRARSSRSRP